jgi:glycosyltransferase involved in cell wall biosynthesis
MISVSCSTKLHSFSLAEQLHRHGLLNSLYTSYAYQKNVFLRPLARRIDKEQVPPEMIQTVTVLAFPIKLFPHFSHEWNELFDLWVAKKISRTESKVFIGWSGMSLNSIRAAKKRGIKTVLERGSTHIVFQNLILNEEYRKFGLTFNVNRKVIEKELLEYREVDYISIPSTFVRNSFIEQGIDESKLIVNPYGARDIGFREEIPKSKTEKFVVIYLGSLSVQKGLKYLFEAIDRLNIPKDEIEIWFIGNVEPEINILIQQKRKPNWKFFGHVDHYDLPRYLSQADVAVQPSLQEGLSLVILQFLANGIPVIITPNTGGGEVVKDGQNGFIVPIRDSLAIAAKIELLFNDRAKLNEMSHHAVSSIKNGFTWVDYGDRYAKFISSLNV